MSHRRLISMLVGAAVLTGCTAPAPVGPADVVVLAEVPGGIAAVSQQHGPFRFVDGRASGFTHDDIGAALAASNIGARITPAAGEQIVKATLAQQCWGQIGADQQTVRPANGADAADLVPTTVWFRVLAGDPNGEQVVISLLADTPQARAAGGFARVDATLRWSDGDWRLRVPVGRASVHPRLAGYRVLAPIGDNS